MSLEDCTIGGFDSVVTGVPKCLHVLNVSSLPNTIPSWNVHKTKNIEVILNFPLHISFMTTPCYFMSLRRKISGTM